MIGTRTAALYATILAAGFGLTVTAARAATVVDMGGGVYSVGSGMVNTNTNNVSGLTQYQFFNDFYIGYWAPQQTAYASSWSGTYGSDYYHYDRWVGTTSFLSDSETMKFSGTYYDGQPYSYLAYYHPVYETIYSSYSCGTFGLSTCYRSYQVQVGSYPVYNTYRTEYSSQFSLNASFVPADTDESSGIVTVPGPIAGAGLPALMVLGGVVWARRRKAVA